MEKILIIDDEQDVHYSFKRLLDGEPLSVLTAASGEEGLRVIAKEKPDVVIMDVRMGGISGLETLKRLRASHPKQIVVMMTAYGTTQTAIEAMKLGAYDYVLKPFDVPKLKALIAAALRTARDMRQVVSYQPLLNAEDYAEGIVGRSEAMQNVFKMIGQVSQSDATVLLTGESGTGKELVARAIYHHSRRAGQPFMAINCAAIPDNLLESELFGHEKGAFTGAVGQRIGKFEQCNRGTIFLDEIGDMQPATQAKVLRILQDGELQRVGGNQTIRVDVRVIAATNKNLEAAVARKEFREDLYYRLNVVHLHMPALRERRDDVRVLVDYFLQKLRKNEKTTVQKISADALKALEKYHWPGNVRELENVIQRAVVVAKSDTITIGDLPAVVAGEESSAATAAEGGAPSQGSDELTDLMRSLFNFARKNPKHKVLPAVEREMIVFALAETNHNQVQAAKLLGITRATLRKRIEKFGIKRELKVQ
jgi:two-component system nitrogen regulation response regulator GlnG